MDIDQRKYILGHSKNVANMSRLMAKLIDCFIILILVALQYPLGILLGVIYLSVSDAIQEGQSVGKKFVGFYVISLEDGSPCSYRQSAIRNLPLTIPLFLAIIPIWGWFLSILLGAAMGVLELLYLFKLESGLRLGDVMADTTVIANHPSAADVSNTTDSWFSKEEKNPQTFKSMKS